MTTIVYAVGLVAAALTTLSYIPQVRKAYPRGSTGDLSLKTLLALGAGLALWVVYGLIRGDKVIIVANSVGVALVVTLVVFKLRDTYWPN